MSLTGAVLIALVAPCAGDEDPVRDALKAFSKNYRRLRTLDDRIEAVRALACHRDPRIADALAYFLTHQEPELRIVTARILAGFGGVKGVGKDLADASKNVANRHKTMRGVVVTLLQSMGTVGGREVVVEINRRIDDRDPYIAKAAIVAAGKLRDGSSVGVLIRHLGDLEGNTGRKVLPDGPLGNALPPQTLSDVLRQSMTTGRDGKPMANRRDLLAQPIQQALTSITRVEFSNAQDWADWWRTNKKTFKVPK